MFRLSGCVAVCLLVLCISQPVHSQQGLESLTVQGCTLQPAFNPRTSKYTCTVPATSPLSPDPSVTISATPSTGFVVDLGNGASTTTVQVAVGQREIKAATQSAKLRSAYFVTLTRPVFNPLSTLSLSGTGASKQFSLGSTELTYSASVSYPTASTSITTGCARAGDTLTIQGQPLANPYNLNVGANIFAIACTSADGASTTHTLTVSRDDTPWLASVRFDRTTVDLVRPQTDYTVSVSANSVTMVISKTSLKVEVNGEPLTAGSKVISFPNGATSTLVTLVLGTSSVTGITTYRFTLTKGALASNLVPSTVQTEVQSALVPK